MTLTDLLPWFALAIFAWFWFDSARAKEAAVKAASQACQSEGLQLLDETVAIDQLRLARSDDGQLRLRRIYRFEYSDTGNNRRRASVVVLGQRVVAVHIGLHLVPEGTPLH